MAIPWGNYENVSEDDYVYDKRFDNPYEHTEDFFDENAYTNELFDNFTTYLLHQCEGSHSISEHFFEYALKHENYSSAQYIYDNMPGQYERSQNFPECIEPMLQNIKITEELVDFILDFIINSDSYKYINNEDPYNFSCRPTFSKLYDDITFYEKKIKDYIEYVYIDSDDIQKKNIYSEIIEYCEKVKKSKISKDIIRTNFQDISEELLVNIYYYYRNKNKESKLFDDTYYSGIRDYEDIILVITNKNTYKYINLYINENDSDYALLKLIFKKNYREFIRYEIDLCDKSDTEQIEKLFDMINHKNDNINSICESIQILVDKKFDDKFIKKILSTFLENNWNYNIKQYIITKLSSIIDQKILLQVIIEYIEKNNYNKLDYNIYENHRFDIEYDQNMLFVFSYNNLESVKNISINFIDKLLIYYKNIYYLLKQNYIYYGSGIIIYSSNSYRKIEQLDEMNKYFGIIKYLLWKKKEQLIKYRIYTRKLKKTNNNYVNFLNILGYLYLI